MQVSLDGSEQKHLREIAARIVKDEPALIATEAFGENTSAGMINGPILIIGDHREIALSKPTGCELYEYRLSLLAREGDLVAISGGRSPDFEAYREDILKLGAAKYVEPRHASVDHSVCLADRCRLDERAFHQIVKLAKRDGSLTIVPHIGMGSAWVLAGTVEKASGCEVRVAAPPPRLTRRANDKLWFAERVRQVLGRSALPPVRGAYGPAALTGQIRALASLYDRIVVKVPDSAGSMGNLSLWSSDIRGVPLPQLRRRLVNLLRDLGWKDRYPLLVEVWDCPVLSSPSVQIWIPNQQDGPPVLEGIFEQIVQGIGGEFIGAAPAQLPSAWRARLSSEALQLATLLQYCGYFGRCSFDSVITGVGYGNSDLHWIECNGRWGGVSIPMTVINRLTGDWARRSFVVVHRSHQPTRPRKLRHALETLKNDLFRTGQNSEGVIVLTPTGIENGTGVNLAALGRTADEARQVAERGVKALTGIDDERTPQ